MTGTDGQDLPKVTFPGVAGDLQRQGDSRAVDRELGRSYAIYNRFLAEQLRDLRSEPDPADYDDVDSYARACDRLLQLLRAEMWLREAHARTQGRRFAESDESRTVSLVDTELRLLSVETGEPVLPDAGLRRPRLAYAPPPPGMGLQWP
jgi:hypothetical protein